MPASRRSLRSVAPLLIAAGLLGGALGGCAKDAPAGLQLAFGTDLIVPDDVNAVALVVTDAARGTLIGAPMVNPTVPSAAGRAVRFPATVALETAFVEDGYAFAGRGTTRAVERVQIALIGLKGATADEATRSGAAVTLRRVVTTMPQTGVHLLRMSLDYLDTGGALGSAASLGIAPNSAPRAGLAPLHLRLADAPLGEIRTACPSEDEDLVAGRCVKVREVDGQSLPDFTASAVYGGGASGTSADATCFDAPTCFAELTPVPIDSAGRATGPWKSFAVLRRSASASADSNATCVGTGAARRCLAVLDGAEGGAGAYRVEGGGVVFDAGILAALASGKIAGIVGSTCAKAPATPVCGPWSSVQNTNNRYATDAGPPPVPSADATVDSALPDSGSSDSGSSDSGGPDAGASSRAVASVDLVVDRSDVADFVVDPTNGGVFALGGLGALDLVYGAIGAPLQVAITPDWGGEGAPLVPPALLDADGPFDNLTVIGQVAGEPRVLKLPVSANRTSIGTPIRPPRLADPATGLVAVGGVPFLWDGNPNGSMVYRYADPSSYTSFSFAGRQVTALTGGANGRFEFGLVDGLVSVPIFNGGPDVANKTSYGGNDPVVAIASTLGANEATTRIYAVRAAAPGALRVEAYNGAHALLGSYAVAGTLGGPRSLAALSSGGTPYLVLPTDRGLEVVDLAAQTSEVLVASAVPQLPLAISAVRGVGACVYVALPSNNPARARTRTQPINLAKPGVYRVCL